MNTKCSIDISSFPNENIALLLCADWIRGKCSQRLVEETGLHAVCELKLLETPFLFYLHSQQREKLDLGVPVKKCKRSEHISFPTVNIVFYMLTRRFLTGNFGLTLHKCPRNFDLNTLGRTCDYLRKCPFF